MHMPSKRSSPFPGRAAAAAPGLILLAFLLAGCGVVERPIGGEQRQLRATRTEPFSTPVAGWPVTVTVQGRLLGTFTSDRNGDVWVDLRPWLGEADAGRGLLVEFRFNQPDGTPEAKAWQFTPEQLKALRR